MRTTIDIPDHLMKKARIKAIEEGITLKKFLTNCLENELTESSGKKSEKPWKALRGQGSADQLKPEDSGFQGYTGPDWNHSLSVNDNEPSE